MQPTQRRLPTGERSAVAVAKIVGEHRLQIDGTDPALGEFLAIDTLGQEGLGAVEPRRADDGFLERQMLEALQGILCNECVDRPLWRQESRGGGDHALEVGVWLVHGG